MKKQSTTGSRGTLPLGNPEVVQGGTGPGLIPDGTPRPNGGG